MISPSDADDLGRPCNSLFEIQVIHRYVFVVVKFCLKSCNLDLHMVYTRGAARIFLRRGGAEVMEAKTLKRKNCL